MGRMLMLLAILLGGQAGVGETAERKRLNIYNWSDYVAPDTIGNFERESGIRVTYDVYDSNETLEAKLFAGKTGYDVVVPSSAFLERLIKAGILRPLDKAKLANLGNLDAAIMRQLESKDPDNRHAVPYMWGTTGIGYNLAKVKERLADAPTGSLDMLFKPEIARRFADCGIALLDTPSEVLEIALNYLGLDPRTGKPEELAKAQAMLLAIRPYVKYFHSSQYIDDLANGEICLALGYSGDVFQARKRAKQGVEVAYAIPKEGTLLWFDLMVIVKDARHPDNAHAFIDYILRPEVAAKISDAVFYANPNAKATALVNPAIARDPAIYPTPEVMARLFTEKAVPREVSRARTRVWQKVTSGK
ncbi:MAG: polyamine ABC transporter substrate-binding protein [Alphaproteobacteria bacterium]|nr:polyamine ABC transporter substrate-binding protein [Alphaproteobacteria bacterium]